MSVETTVPGEVALTVLLAVRDEAPDWLERTLQSLLCQSHPGWELCLCDNGSEDPQTRRLLERYRGRDPRIKLLQLGAPLAASQAVNAAVEFATGLCVAFIAAGDALDLDAVAVLAAALEQHPEAALFYSDEDCIGPDGRHAAPYLKPDWSPEHLLSTMYLGRLLVLRKARFLELGGLAVAAGTAADYDLALRATARRGRRSRPACRDATRRRTRRCWRPSWRRAASAWKPVCARAASVRAGRSIGRGRSRC